MNSTNNQPPKKKGRPSQFATEEERVAHRKEYQKQYRLKHKKNLSKVIELPSPPIHEPIIESTLKPVIESTPIQIINPNPSTNIGQLFLDQLEWTPHHNLEYANYVDITFIRNLEPIGKHKPHTMYDIQSLIDQHHQIGRASCRERV